MTKPLISILSATFLFIPTLVMAEDITVGATTETVVAKAEKIADDVTGAAPLLPDSSLPLETPAVEAPVVTTDTVTAPLEAVAAPVIEAPSVITEAIPTDNLEFISGEISSADEATQSVNVKLYGETESGTSDKTLKVTVDGTTDITDGEQDRDLKSLTAGTEVDVEYDPATNKATYIFVY